MSDLHFEFSEIMPDQAEARLPGGDVLVLAGDIAPIKGIVAGRYKNLPKFLEIAANKYRKIYAVAGNHELYGATIGRETLDALHRFYDGLGVTFLDGASDTFEGVKFFGGTFWTDMNNADPEVMALGPRYMNDYRVISGLTPEAQIELHRWCVEAMKNASPDVVISHHAPGIGSIDSRFRHEGLANFLYYSDIQIPESVKFWIHGHVHCRVAYRKDGCQVRANPRGYPAETKHNGFDFGATIEI